MTDGEALLAAILANPEEDAPRLVYADWLQENGEAERAEFIRKAIAYPHCSFLELTGGNPFELLGIPEPPMGRVMGRPSGHPAIDAANSRTWMWGESEELGCVIHDLVRDVNYREHHGFVQAIKLPLAAWELHAAEIWARHPVTRVVLTDRKPLPSAGGESASNWWSDDKNPQLGSPHRLPLDIFQFLEGGLFFKHDWESLRYRSYESDKLAHDALSHAACLVGRRRARDRQRQTQEVTL